MNTVQLKTNFHKLIDTFNNESVLLKFYELLLKAKESKDSHLWSRLSVEEQEELKLIEKQSHDPGNLIPQTEITKKHKKWL